MRARWLFVASLALATTACGSSAPPTAPGPPPVTEPAITCPASVAVITASTSAVATFAAPVSSGGTPPTTFACTATSGATFPVGTTAVQCTHTDAIGRSAVCNFNITVTFRAFVKYTKFWAFGDSITAGEVSTSSFSSIKYLDAVNNYPVVLRGLLGDRYAQQTITLANQGVSGERADAGADRIRASLIAGPVPDVLLLLEGTNKMLSSDTSLVPTIVPTISVMIDEAFVRGVKEVMIATFPPVRAGIRGSLAAPYILSTNSDLKALAAAKVAAGRKVYVIDLYAAMVGQENTLIGDDGLHPTVAGYRKIADTFMTAIRATYEQASAPTSLSLFKR